MPQNSLLQYQNRWIETTQPPASEQALEHIETVLGTTLPEDYKNFLRTVNGGYLEYDLSVSFEDGSHEYLSFSALFHADMADEWESNPFELTQARQHPDFPRFGVLPIARDGGSSVLYLDLRQGCQIVAHVAGLPAWTGKRQQDTLLVVASSFDDYLQRLTLSKETILGHIQAFDATPDTVQATLEWFDSAGKTWRQAYQTIWNEKVPFHPI
ncbi:SMI1/KNR4 family protein [Alcaligenaceae bacterium SJ-26]|nr:SMI1/KNR4 family protein [Alcaligenaceae bacterium SJ-26]